MGTKLTGKLLLSRIPKECVQSDANGNKFIFIDILERKEVGKYGDTHTLTTYNKDTKETIYLANLTKKEFGGGAKQVEKPVEKPIDVNGDLPF